MKMFAELPRGRTICELMASSRDVRTCSAGARTPSLLRRGEGPERYILCGEAEKCGEPRPRGMLADPGSVLPLQAAGELLGSLLIGGRGVRLAQLAPGRRGHLELPLGRGEPAV